MRERFEDEGRLRERIEELEEANRALRASEEKYRTLVDNIDVGVFRTRTDGRLPPMQVNPAMARIFGYDDASELLDVPTYQFYVDPRDRDAMIDDLERDRQVKSREVRMRRRDGTTIVVSVTLTAIRGEGGEIESIDSVAEDITDRKKAEEELRRSRQMLQLVLDNIPVRVFWKDRDLNFLGANRVMAEDAGLSDPAEIVGRNDYEVAWRESADRYRENDREVLSTGQSKLKYDEPQVQADGEVRWLQTSKVPLRDADENIVGVLGMYEDVTERKRVEKDLRESEERFRALSDATFEGIVVHSDGTILDLNKACLEQTGYGRDELLGRSILDLFSPESRDALQKVIQRPAVDPSEAYLVRKGGEVRTVQIKGRTMEYGGKQARVATLVDITEQVRARERIEELMARKEEERVRLRALLETLPVGVIIMDPAGLVVENNQRAKDIWSTYTDQSPRDLAQYRDLKGWWADTGIPLRPEDWTVVKAMKEKRTIIGQTIDVQRQDGRRGTILNSAAPLMEHDEVVGGVAVTEDITRQRELEHEAIEAKERAELYIDLLTHDINNMNAAATGYLELVQKSADLDEGSGQKLDKCHQALNDISELIEKVKKIQQVEGSGARRGLVDLGWTIEDVVRTLRDYPGKEVVINYRPQMGKMVVASELLTDVFANIVGNAVKHSRGAVAIDVNLGTAFDQGREQYVVTVEDDGPGITDEAKGKVFSRLQRGKTTASGSGLGLFLVKTLVEDFSGRAWVEDRVPGDHTKGAKFVVMLPVARTPIDYDQ